MLMTDFKIKFKTAGVILCVYVLAFILSVSSYKSESLFSLKQNVKVKPIFTDGNTIWDDFDITILKGVSKNIKDNVLKYNVLKLKDKQGRVFILKTMVYAEELLCDMIYHAAGIDIPPVAIFKTKQIHKNIKSMFFFNKDLKNFPVCKVAVFIDGQKWEKSRVIKDLTAKQEKSLKAGIIVDSWLFNTDIAPNMKPRSRGNKHGGNVIIRKNKAYRIDNGYTPRTAGFLMSRQL